VRAVQHTRCGCMKYGNVSNSNEGWGGGRACKQCAADDACKVVVGGVYEET
jgi:hypothetical protein